MFILTVDPGFNTGVAVWQFGRAKENLYTLHEVKTLKIEKTKKPKDSLQKFEELFLKFKKLIQVYNPKKIYIEGTKIYDPRKSKDILVLTGLIYSYFGLCITYHIKYELVPVSIWKGTLNKVQTRNRISTILEKHPMRNEHEWDAVGIGCAMLLGGL